MSEARVVRGPSLSLVLGAASLACLVAAFWLNEHPGGLGLLWDCPFKLLTGVPCFLCGITRVYLLLAAGDVAGAVALAPLPFLLVTGALIALVWWLVARARGGRDPDVVIGHWLAPRVMKVLVVVSALALWGYAITRSLSIGAP